MNAVADPIGGGRRALLLGVLAGLFFAAILGLAAGPAHAAFSTRVQAGVLTVNGDLASDKLALRLQPGSPNVLQVDVGDDGTADFSFDRTTFTAVVVHGGAGDDQLRIDQSGGLFLDEAVTLDGGAGNDTLIGAAGADTLIGGTGDDFADGNIGADVVQLGAGDDTNQWDPGDGSDVVEGQDGNDLLAFNGSNIGEQIELSPNGSRVRLTRDVAAISLDLNGIERATIRMFGGMDTLTVDNLAGTALKTVDADLRATDGQGDLTADTVIARGTDGHDSVGFASPDGVAVATGLGAQTHVTGGEPAFDNLVVQTLGGADTATMTLGVASPIPVHVDGGEGDDLAKVNGTAGDDQISFARGATEVVMEAPATALFETSTEHVAVAGGDGADTISAGNGLASLTSMTLDGGPGSDTLRGSDGADTLIGGTGDDFADGNIGADVVQLGAGDDTNQWDPGDGSDVVEGQDGNDLLAFNGSNIGEQIELSPNGSRVRLTRDVAAISLDLNGIERATIRMFGGMDTLTVDNLAGTALKTVDADLRATDGQGDLTADTVIARGTDGHDSVGFASPDGVAVATGLGAQTHVTGGEPAFDNLVVQTLGGADTATMTLGVASPIPVHVDGGEGDDLAKVNGTAGDDQISFARGATEVVMEAPATALFETSTEHVAVAGGDGADTISAGNGLASLTSMTLDGGPGSDTLRGSDGADTLIGGTGDDFADGNIGADVVQLGAGDDTNQWDPGDGSDVVEGQDGNDLLAFNGSNIGEQIELSPNGSRVRLTRDVAAISLDLNGIERATIRMFGGMDTLTVDNLAGTALKTVDADLRATDGQGDLTPDTVIVNGTDRRDAVDVTSSAPQVLVAGLAAQTRIAGSEPTLDTLRVQTLAGNDVVSVAPGVSDLITPVVDLGPDQ